MVQVYVHVVTDVIYDEEGVAKKHEINDDNDKITRCGLVLNTMRYVCALISID